MTASSRFLPSTAKTHLAWIGVFGLVSVGFAQRNLHDETFRFASQVVSHAGLGAGLYGDPAAALGRPTTWVADPQNGGPAGRQAAEGEP